MRMLNHKKGVTGLQGFIYGVIAIAVIVGIGLYILLQLQYATTSDGTSTGTATAASNATGDMITQLAKAPTWVGLLIVVVFATAILGYFYMKE